MSNSGIGGYRIGQHEPLVVRLANLLREYTEGVGILKELVQNADDAKASVIHIIFDRRRHEIGELPDPRMSKLLGPAVLVFNDAVFSEQDFKNITQLGFSGKLEDMTKTGRFGLGFNSVYHITDYPSFITRDQIVFFDPNLDCIPDTSNAEPGHGWRYAEENWWQRFPDLLGLYSVAGLEIGTADFQGTIFRFPLRTVELAPSSKIRQTPFTASNLDEMIDAFWDMGEQMMLFLKSLERITIEEITANGEKNVLLDIVTTNLEEVRSARRELMSAISGSYDELISRCLDKSSPLPWQRYRHAFSIITDETNYRSEWQIINGMRISGKLLDLMQQMHRHREKAIPCAGAAARLWAEGDANDVEGKVFCFLPLPIETHAPVHLHGFFDLDASRHNILSSSGGHTGKDAVRVKWNEQIAGLVATAWSELIVELSHVKWKELKIYYDHWPHNVQLTSKVFETLQGNILRQLRDKEVVQTHQGWKKPEEVVYYKSDQGPLVLPLIDDGVPLPSGWFPYDVLNAYRKHGIPLQQLDHNWLRKHYSRSDGLDVPLDQAPWPSLRKREWLFNIVQYYWMTGDRKSPLRNMPFGLVQDGNLKVLGKPEDDFTFIENDPLLKAVFSDCQGWFIDEELQKKFQFPADEHCRLFKMDPGWFLRCLEELLPQTEGSSVAWDGKAPDSQWLAQVYQYMSQFKHFDIKIGGQYQLCMLPGSDGNLHLASQPAMPWLVSQDAIRLKAALRYFDIPYIEGAEELETAIHQFFKRHPKQTLVRHLTPDHLVKILTERSTKLPQYHAEHYAAVLTFLLSETWWNRPSAPPHRKKELQELYEHLRRLPIYPTHSNELTDLAREGVFLQGNYQVPKLPLSISLLKPGSWSETYKEFNIEELSPLVLATNLVLPSYTKLKIDEQFQALDWLRRQYHLLTEEAQNRGTNDGLVKKFLERMQQTALIRGNDGRLYRASDLFDPKHSLIRQMFGSFVPYPDMKYYNKDQEHWLTIFRKMGLRSEPGAQDIAAFVSSLYDLVDSTGLSEELIHACQGLYAYVIEQGMPLLQKEIKHARFSRLGELLKTCAWIPPVQDIEPYFLAAQVELKLYRPEQIYFTQHCNLMASQAPMLSTARQPSREIQNALGFQIPNPDLVLKQFERVLDWFRLEAPSAAESQLKKAYHAIRAIYNYVFDYIVRPGQNSAFKSHEEKVRQFFRSRPSLLGRDRKRLWRPQHMFAKPVSYFGTRRCGFNSDEENIQKIYEWAGQKSRPDVSDFLALIDEIWGDYLDEVLSEADQKIVIESLKQLVQLPHLDKVPFKGLVLLSETGCLSTPNRLLMADSDWGRDQIDREVIHVLHPEVPLQIAKLAGCFSMLKDTDQAPAAQITPSHDKELSRFCHQWQAILRHKKFHRALQRLIRRDHLVDDFPDFEMLRKIKIEPTHKLYMNLFLNTETKRLLIAKNIPGDFHWSEEDGTVYLKGSRKLPMLHFLLTALNMYLRRQGLGLKSIDIPFLLCQDNQPEKILEMLDDLRIPELPKHLLERNLQTVAENEIEIENSFEDWDDDNVHAEATASTTSRDKARNTASQAHKQSSGSNSSFEDQELPSLDQFSSMPDIPQATPSEGFGYLSTQANQAHTPYAGEHFQSGPRVSIDEEKLRRQMPDVEIQKHEASFREKPAAQEQVFKTVTKGRICLLARSFTDGMLWMQSPEDLRALFPPDEVHRDDADVAWFPFVLSDMEEDSTPMKLLVDYEKKIIYPAAEHRQTLIDFFEDSELMPGCLLEVELKENKVYDLGFRYHEYTVTDLPILTLDQKTGVVSIQLLPQTITLPCQVNKNLLVSQQRFADTEAITALMKHAETAPDVLNTLVFLMKERTEAISKQELYLLFFQIRPISWSYFSQILSRNSGPNKLLEIDGEMITARPDAQVIVKSVAASNQVDLRRSVQTFQNMNWLELESSLKRWLKAHRLTSHQSLALKILDCIRSEISDYSN